jgi:hypothetical protein
VRLIRGARSRACRHGSYFGAVPLTASDGKAGGALFIYRGAPSWLMVTVEGAYRSSAKRCRRLGRAVAVGEPDVAASAATSAASPNSSPTWSASSDRQKRATRFAHAPT